jgi:hypothetical protein
MQKHHAGPEDVLGASRRTGKSPGYVHPPTSPPPARNSWTRRTRTRTHRRRPRQCRRRLSRGTKSGAVTLSVVSRHRMRHGQPQGWQRLCSECSLSTDGKCKARLRWRFTSARARSLGATAIGPSPASGRPVRTEV